MRLVVRAFAARRGTVDGKSAIILIFRRFEFRNFKGTGERELLAFARPFFCCVLDFSDFLNGLNPRTAKKETFEGNRRRRVARRPEGLLAPTFILAAISF